MAACFVLPTGPAYALVFYFVVVPCVLARLALRQVSRDRPFWCGVALVVWSGLTLTWGRDDGGRVTAMALGAACTCAFWFAATTALDGEKVRRHLTNVLIWLGTANAVVAIGRYVLLPAYVAVGQPKRLHGWGVTTHPVLGAAVFSLCCLTALAAADQDRRRRGWHLAAAAVMALAVVLTKSRGPELALMAAAAVLLAAGPARRWAPMLLLAGPVGWGLWRLGFWRTGDSGHLQVWRAAWAQIMARPWLGNGLAADLPAQIGADKRFPHDLYLSLLFYSGVVGLLLFAVWAGGLIWRTARRAEAAWVLALWANGLLAGLTDFGQITKGPGPLWLILWLPAALSATTWPRGSTCERKAGGFAPSTPTGVPPGSSALRGTELCAAQRR